MNNENLFAVDQTEQQEVKNRPIHTPDQLLRVFISSTIEELAGERRAAEAAIRQMGITPVFFEIGARPYPPRALYTAYLEQSDVFIGIYWKKYGWIAPGMTISGLEDEFQMSKNMPRLIYLKKADDREPRLTLMLEQISNVGLSYKSFNSEIELRQLILNDLAILLTDNFVARQHRLDSVQLKKQSFLPLPSNSLIGRNNELDNLKAMVLVEGARLITLTGTGGVGKSRLALELIHSISSHFHDGTYYVRLDFIKDPAAVPSAIFRVLFPDETIGNSPDKLLCERLHSKKTCILLDNFEQVIDAAFFLSKLLESCSHLTLIVTSRESLLISAENEYPVKPLSIFYNTTSSNLLDAAKDNSSVKLFIQRCKSIKPNFSLTEENVADVVNICNTLEGLPLAIEMAAARIKLFSPRSIVRMLNKKLDFFSIKTRDLPDRHHTLRATIEWSYNILNEEEKKLLLLMAIFNGGFSFITLHGLLKISSVAATFPRLGMFLSTKGSSSSHEPEISQHLITMVESLLSKNLIHARTDRSGEQRFQLYSAIKDYMMQMNEQEGRMQELNQKHLLYFLQFTEAIHPLLTKTDDIFWLSLLDEEMANLTSALQWSLENNPVYGLRIAIAISEYWDTRANTTEGSWWITELIKRSGNQKFNSSGKILAIGWLELARLKFREQNIEELSQCLKHVETYLSSNKDEYIELDLASFKMMTSGFSGDESPNEKIFEELLQDSHKLHYKIQVLNFMQSAAAGEIFSGSVEKGYEIAKESYKLSKEIGAHRWIFISKLLLGFAELSREKIEEAKNYFLSCCIICNQVGDRILIVHPLIGLVQIAIAKSKLDESGKLLGCIYKQMEQPGLTPVHSIASVLKSLSLQVEEALGTSKYKKYISGGYILNHENIMKFINSI